MSGASGARRRRVVLFIHHHFPAQYLHLAQHLGRLSGWRVLFLTQNAGGAELPGVERRVYAAPAPQVLACHPYNQAHEAGVRTGLAVLAACRELLAEGITPDLVIGHCGWGEMLLVKQAFPATPVLGYFEYYYHAQGLDVGYDPEFAPSRPDDSERLWLRNSVQQLSFTAVDHGHTATRWQRSLFPAEWQSHIQVLHEGVDTLEVRPDPAARFQLPDGRSLQAGDEVLTYVARNLEPYRGFHCLLRALPEVLARRPQAQVVIAGGEGVSYGDLPPYGGSWRGLLQMELGDRMDWQRVHFVGHLARPAYLTLLQVSRLHTYLSYPFVPSWSCVEALASGCLVLGNDVAPIRELIHEGENGHLVDMRDTPALAGKISTLLAEPNRHNAIRARARQRAAAEFDLNGHCLPRWMEAIEALCGETSRGPRTGAGVRSEL